MTWLQEYKIPSEEACSDIIVKRLLAGNRGHFGCFEHAQIVLNVGFFPHSVMQQLRTYRIPSFDVQSFRYNSDSILDVESGKASVEDAFYLRPVGFYIDREGSTSAILRMSAKVI